MNKGREILVAMLNHGRRVSGTLALNSLYEEPKQNFYWARPKEFPHFPHRLLVTDPTDLLRYTFYTARKTSCSTTHKQLEGGSRDNRTERAFQNRNSRWKGERREKGDRGR
jgi:hypothetical protein